MRALRFASALLVGVLGPGLTCASGAGFGLFRNYWGNVIVNTDMTPGGRALTPATADTPVYYLGQSLGNKLGSIPGDDEPEARELIPFVTKILAKQGYVGATPGVHDPALFLVVQWGYMQPGSDLTWFLGYDASKDIGAPVMSGMLGPEVFRRNFRSRTVETILDNASDANYGIIVSAFDYKTARTPKPVILWQTRIALPANGKTMAQALPTMLLAAGNAIGRESDSSQLRDADEAREGRVNFGEFKVLDVVKDPSHNADSGAK